MILLKSKLHLYNCYNILQFMIALLPWLVQENIVIQSLGIVLEQDPVSIFDKTSYRKISQSLEAARFLFRIVRSLWNLTGTSAALLPMCLSNFIAMRWSKLPIARLRDFMRSYGKTSYRVLKRGPDCNCGKIWNVGQKLLVGHVQLKLSLSFSGISTIEKINKECIYLPYIIILPSIFVTGC